MRKQTFAESSTQHLFSLCMLISYRMTTLIAAYYVSGVAMHSDSANFMGSKYSFTYYKETMSGIVIL